MRQIKNGVYHQMNINRQSVGYSFFLCFFLKNTFMTFPAYSVSHLIKYNSQGSTIQSTYFFCEKLKSFNINIMQIYAHCICH